MIIHTMNTTALPVATQPLQAGVAAVPHLGVIRARGADAASFLHGQLTQDFLLMKPNEARLAAFCSAKGRMQASFVAVKRTAPDGETEILLIGSRDILAATLKRLSMFVLRAKVKLTDASDEFALCGLSGNAITSIAEEPRSAWACDHFDQMVLITLYPADGMARALWVAPAGTPLPAGPVLDSASWRWGEVRSGIADITGPIVDAFVPQMLNYESVGGVNFKKGCYPGQEVVARSQFRGTLKRRGYLVHADSAMTAGQEVFGAGDDTQPCGMVAQAAAAPDGGFDAIVSMQVAAAQAGGLTLAGGAAQLEVLPLPYPLLADI
jgi:folate-binding protein YgfZ